MDNCMLKRFLSFQVVPFVGTTEFFKCAMHFYIFYLWSTFMLNKFSTWSLFTDSGQTVPTGPL